MTSPKAHEPTLVLAAGTFGPLYLLYRAQLQYALDDTLWLMCFGVMGIYAVMCYLMVLGVNGATVSEKRTLGLTLCTLAVTCAHLAYGTLAASSTLVLFFVLMIVGGQRRSG